jgi:hypothetical protein
MTHNELLLYRFSEARVYLEYLETSLQKHWDDQYHDYQSKILSLPQALTLVHPWQYERILKSDIARIQGPRSFPTDIGISSLTCRSETIWGYTCSCHTQNNLQADHLFPHSLGGPTLPDNKIYLCSFHNQMKGSDIHLFPWEKGEPHWLKAQLDLIYATYVHQG